MAKNKNKRNSYRKTAVAELELFFHITFIPAVLLVTRYEMGDPSV